MDWDDTKRCEVASRNPRLGEEKFAGAPRIKEMAPINFLDGSPRAPDGAKGCRGRSRRRRQCDDVRAATRLALLVDAVVISDGAEVRVE